MKMVDEKVRSEKMYRVGYLPGIEKYAMACVVAGIAWYDRFFEITKEEYNSFGSEELDQLAKELSYQGSKSQRFLFSEKNEENTKDRLAFRKKAQDENLIDFKPTLFGKVMGYLLVLCGLIALASGTSLLMDDTIGLFYKIAGILELPLGIYAVALGLGYAHVRVMVEDNKMTIRRIFKKTVVLDVEDIFTYSNAVSWDGVESHRYNAIVISNGPFILTIRTKEACYKIKYGKMFMSGYDELISYLDEKVGVIDE